MPFERKQGHRDPGKAPLPLQWKLHELPVLKKRPIKIKKGTWEVLIWQLPTEK